VHEAVSTIWAVRSRSDGGDQTREDERLRTTPLLFAAVSSPELGQARARVDPGSPGLGREREHHGELNGEEEAMNPRTEGEERQGEGLGQTGGTPARHSGHEEGA
jgi:hypothetical protein